MTGPLSPTVGDQASRHVPAGSSLTCERSAPGVPIPSRVSGGGQGRHRPHPRRAASTVGDAGS